MYFRNEHFRRDHMYLNHYPENKWPSSNETTRKTNSQNKNIKNIKNTSQKQNKAKSASTNNCKATPSNTTNNTSKTQWGTSPRTSKKYQWPTPKQKMNWMLLWTYVMTCWKGKKELNHRRYPRCRTCKKTSRISRCYLQPWSYCQDCNLWSSPHSAVSTTLTDVS